MTRYERLNLLLELLADRGKVEVDEIAGELGVSAATIRRDLDHLAEQQLLTRTRGGAVAQSVADLPLRYKSARHRDEKSRIGQAAAALVRPGMVVGMNGGTTATEVARAIALRTDLDGASDGPNGTQPSSNAGPSPRAAGAPAVTIVTNALNIANELVVRPLIRVVVTGGAARPQSYELVGPLATRILPEISLDLLVLGVDAIDPAAGATAHNEGEASINALMVSRAGHVAVVADSSKLGTRAFARICPIAAITTLITDSGAGDDAVRVFEDAGVKVIRA